MAGACQGTPHGTLQSTPQGASPGPSDPAPTQDIPPIQGARTEGSFGSQGWAGPYLQCKTKYGFTNPKYLCYRNAIVVLLLHTPALLSRLESHPCQNNCAEKPCFFCLFRDLFHSYWLGGDGNNTGHQGEQSADGEEHNQLLRSIWQNHLRKGWKINNSEVTDNEQQDVGEFLNRFFSVLSKGKPSFPILDLFESEISKDRICKNPTCKKLTSLPNDRSSLLVGPFPTGKDAKIEDFITNCLKDSDDNTKCNSCSGSVSIQSKFRTLPEVLLVQPNRVDFLGGRARKNVRELDFGSRLVIDRGGNEEVRYELFAVVYHLGRSANAGHYRVAVKGPTGQWTLVDDEKITEFEGFQTLRGTPRRRANACLFAYRKSAEQTPTEEAQPENAAIKEVTSVNYGGPGGKLKATLVLGEEDIVQTMELPLDSPSMLLKFGEQKLSVKLHFTQVSKTGDVYGVSRTLRLRLKRKSPAVRRVGTRGQVSKNTKK